VLSFAQQLIDAAAISVGSQHSASHQLGVRYGCEDLETLRKRLDVAGTLQQHQVGQLLTTIGSIGETTAAMLIATLRGLSALRKRECINRLCGACPSHKHSGKHQPKSSSLSPIGNRRLRRALWMPTLSAATQSNPWLIVFYRRLIQRGKPHKVALCAAMRKLLAAIYSVAKYRRPFVPFLNPQSAVRLDYEKARSATRYLISGCLLEKVHQNLQSLADRVRVVVGYCVHFRQPPHGVGGFAKVSNWKARKYFLKPCQCLSFFLTHLFLLLKTMLLAQPRAIQRTEPSGLF
jgi:hypothetical protein